MKRNKNKVICVNDTDKNLGAANGDIGDVKAECRRQLYDAFTYQKLTEEQMIEFIRNVKFQLKSLVEKHLYKGNCSIKEAKFLLSNMDEFKIPHFYIIWKSLNPLVGRPIVAGYNWILSLHLYLWDTILQNFFANLILASR